LFLPLAYSLTRKLKNEKYFFIPSTRIIYMIAIIFTFAICGIWHGEGINYLLWGLFFGISLTYANWTEKFRKKIRKSIGISKNSFIYQIIKILTTFTLVSFAWIFFRADNTAMAFKIIKKIFSDQGTFFIDQPSNMIYSFFGIVFIIAIELKQEFLTKSNLPYESISWFKEQLFYGTLILIILMIGVLDGGQFIYFQF
jgi:alginate O-acetyltransferase complex protein AlgI